MSDGVYLVFSDPPASVSQEEYRSWYLEHVAENIETDGFDTGQRYALDHIADRPGASSAQVGEAGGFTHLAIYETTGDIETLRSALDTRLAAGDIVLPDWFPEIRFSSWHCTPLGAKQIPGGHD
jgi:hypothetical protein